ncbi:MULTISPECIES: histidinol-phosphate transaminase [Pseudomonadaceae]|jgi:histidinol-phosphate aminotransferase|uniref:Histidinol-phosphate aminotransferase n=2 Tax=Stutzerimonas stutzeri subgroup TaxID=578833 RepID=A0A5S5BAG1_STUST|nr:MULTISPECIES: histidinol-phosphate transaminase [Pseudomonadaceae]MBU0810867.1 histidinol-phosphate transaminase [Gammaproteobacteria bacterium]MBU0851769.1 histidinol-phosphate transaminase [Gammaproteobacteria bacterium]MBU1774501.1 histidinol-phosphate transaminase [Gammaproteobacteria bacterium]MDX2354324.1 histidinol-phosphate transaminase [Stutzerimonas xanthomarina]TYP63316.1 histidinol-phosphate aminotransferase [Stutzerimonas stutzeri]|tara:strand:- start:6199 stop:7254 length:1056 start_codon:yes stop_codon:yes gene_type:complete
MSKFWSPFVKALVPYVPGEQPKLTNLVKLNTNENPYGPSPKALAAMQAELNDNLRLYPDPNGERLKRAVADYYHVRPEQVFVGNGSDEVLAHVFHGLFQHGKPLLFPDVTYSFYPVYCGLYGIDYETIALDDRFQIEVADYARPNGGIIFPNPNAPTGCLLALEAIEQLLQANPDSVVVVDEAYIDFGGESAIALVDRYPNLLVTQTLSKSRSLAGLRVGLAVGHPDLIEALERIKNSFNSYPLDRIAIAGAAAAFEDRAYFEQTCQQVIASREAVTVAMQALGFEVLPSAANFIFARHPQHDAAALAAGLREHGVIVRHFKMGRIDQFLRISVGAPEQNQALLDALKRIG